MMLARMKKLVANTRGAAVIELALVAPLFAMMTIGIVDMSNAYSRKLALEQGAQRAIEKIMQTTQLSTVEDTLTTEAICQVNGTNADGTCKTSPITTSNVSVTWRRECTDSSGTMTQAPSSPYSTSAAFDADACPSGTAKEADYIKISLTDKYVPMFPMHFGGYNASDGGYDITASAGVRTK